MSHPLKSSVSPKELAEAIGVSESSIKRWVDDGTIEAERTAGGHRRIPIEIAADFIRANRHTVHQPEALGFAQALQQEADPQSIDEAFWHAIREGNNAQAIGLVTGLYLQGQSIPRLCDHPIHAGYQRVREDCPHPNEKCFTLHRSRDICRQALATLRQMLPALDANAPHAAGGDIGYSIDSLPTSLAATALRSMGFATTDLGESVPQEILLGAMKKHRPELLWISASGRGKVKPKALKTILESVVEHNHKGRTQILLTGDAFNEATAANLPHTSYVRSIAELAAFAEGLRQQR